MVVAYRKTTHPHNKHEAQGYEQTDTADTMNAFDEGENRTLIIVLEGHGSRPSHMGNGYSESDTMYTLNTIEQHSVCYPRCYQKTVGALCADDWRMINKQYVDQNKVVCYESICIGEPSERQQDNHRSERDRSDAVEQDGNGREQHSVCPSYFYESRFAEWKPYEVASVRASGGTCGKGSEGLVCYELVR